jgi:Geranylgeranyl pyrophosphate synthase
MDPSAVALVDELLRLLGAGGKRVRPALCFWSFRAAGGPEGDPIVRVCGALELLHTSALVHDDLMDRDVERRGVASTHVRFAEEAPAGADPDGFGSSAAILVGDLALVLSERMIRTSGFGAGRLEPAMTRFDRMRVEMAAGQFLDVSGQDVSGMGDGARVRSLKTGSYTAEGPVMIGAALAGAGPQAEGPLRVFGRLVGEAFQLRDDVADGDAASDAGDEVDDLVTRAVRALGDAPLRREGVDALIEIAELLRAPWAA